MELKDVLDLTSGQVVGGDVLVSTPNGNVLLGHNTEDGVVLTDEGQAYVDDLTPKRRRKTVEVQAEPAVVEDVVETPVAEQPT